MNERIKQLAEQANANFGRDLEFAVVFGELEDFNKFAELIIQECIEIVEPCKCGCCNEPEAMITETIIKQIKQHFEIK